MRADDTLVVLGAAVWAGEVPSPSLRRRALHAAKLYHAGVARSIIGSGGVGRHPPSEAEMIRRLCVEAGVPDEAIVLDDASRSTLENVLFSARIVRARGGSRVIVVSDRYHLPRAVLCFRALGVDATGSGPERRRAETPLWRWLYYCAREIVAIPYYLVVITLERARQRRPGRGCRP